MLSYLLAALESEEDKRRFTELYEENHVRAEQTALRILRDPHDAEDAVQRLLALGADINKRNSYTRDTPILRSLYTNHDDITRLLYYADADLNLENNYRISPMFLAVEKQKAEFVDLFLTNGAQAGVNSENLFRWVAKRNLLGIVAMLKGGVNPNVKNDKGNTPLIISASLGDVDAVQNLLAYRSDVNAANNDGNNGVFLIISADAENDVKIPGAAYGFNDLVNAQALGDFKALAEKGRRVIKVHVKKPLAQGLNKLASLF